MQDSRFKIIYFACNKNAHLRGLGRSPEGRAREGVSKSEILTRSISEKFVNCEPTPNRMRSRAVARTRLRSEGGKACVAGLIVNLES